MFCSQTYSLGVSDQADPDHGANIDLNRILRCSSASTPVIGMILLIAIPVTLGSWDFLQPFQAYGELYNAFDVTGILETSFPIWSTAGNMASPSSTT
jgi:hypothetical protein